MTEASAAKKAQEAALKYAARQHRARADMIANTELAFAYNRGENMSIRNAMREGLMGACVKVWRTAGSERVCPKCGALNGKEIGFDESFDIGAERCSPECTKRLLRILVAAVWFSTRKPLRPQED